MNQKGISPIVATVFLIAVSVALGSVVMSLGEEYVTHSEESFCSSLNYEIKKIIFEDGEVRVTVDNGETQIEGYTVKMFNNDYSDVDTKDVTVTIPPNGAKVFSFKTSLASLHEIKLIPKTYKQTCTDNYMAFTKESNVLSNE